MAALWRMLAVLAAIGNPFVNGRGTLLRKATPSTTGPLEWRDLHQKMSLEISTFETQWNNQQCRTESTSFHHPAPCSFSVTRVVCGGHLAAVQHVAGKDRGKTPQDFWHLTACRGLRRLTSLEMKVSPKNRKKRNPYVT